MNVVAGIFLIVGSLLTMIGGIGVVRFNDLMSRVHAAAKAPTLGLLLVAIGAAIEIGSGKAVVTLLLVVVLQLFTSPVATHVLARASYGQVDIELDGGDDLAQHFAEAAAAEAAKLTEKGTAPPRDEGDEGDEGNEGND
jgi:multicomponent Na+:H+ antiporter subunit G